MAWKPQPPSRPHRGNSAGDFYVEDNCCITCGMPEAEAPEVFGWFEEAGSPMSCVVVRQPKAPESIDRTLAAMLAAEVDCIRYRGNDPDIGRRLVEAGLANQCDQAPPPDAVPLTRSHVTFQVLDSTKYSDILQLAQDFLQYFRKCFPDRSGFKGGDARFLEANPGHAEVEISWSNSVYHIVEFKEVGSRNWLAINRPRIPAAGIGLSRIVDDYLKTDGQFADVRWFSAEQWKAGGPYQPTVI